MRRERSGLETPSTPVRVIFGKRSALATPIRAVAAWRSCSTWTTSGRRWSSSDGRPGGTAGGSTCSVSERPRAMAWGLRPSSTLIWFSFWTICRSNSAARAAAFDRSRPQRSPADSDRLFPGQNRAFGNLQLHVELEEVEIRLGHSAHQLEYHGPPVPFTGEQVRASGFIGPTNPAPDINLPREIALRVIVKDIGEP